MPVNALPPPAAPDVVWIQAGTARDTRSVAIGTAWDLAWRSRWLGGDVRTFASVGAGRWFTRRDEPGRGDVTQFGFKPVLRWHAFPGDRKWYVEAGVGPNWITPKYRVGSKRFSTTFNFGDHLAIGRSFGGAELHEFSLRIEHFSNGGIRQPNPGEDFVQIRYSWRP